MPHSRDSRFVRLVLVIFFILAILYAAYEARGMLYGPAIHVSDEKPLAYEAFTSIEGRALRITELRLNGKTIQVTENGDFSESFLLAPGVNRVILEANDARGRMATKKLDIVYIAGPDDAFPLEAASSSPAATSTPKQQ